MIAVGNDVVDLRDPESDPATLHPRFDARVFASCEREALAGSRDPAGLRWRLWAAKEAAYKAARKLSPATVFSPSRFVASAGLRQGADVGTVEHAGAAARIELAGAEQVVHAIACQSASACDDVGEAKIVAALRRLRDDDPRRLDPQGPSEAVRTFACERIAAALEVAGDALEIRRSGRIPELWLEGCDTPLDLSLSHHGRYVAFVCALPARAFQGSVPARVANAERVASELCA